MMGYPGIQKVRIDKKGVEIERLTKGLEKKTNDKIIHKELEQKLGEIKERESVLSPKMLLTVVHAQIATGQQEQAYKNVERILSLAPHSAVADEASRLLETAKINKDSGG